MEVCSSMRYSTKNVFMRTGCVNSVRSIIVPQLFDWGQRITFSLYFISLPRMTMKNEHVISMLGFES